MKLDVVGIVVDYEIKDNELVFLVDVNGKIIRYRGKSSKSYGY